MVNRLAILYDKQEILNVSFREFFEIVKMGYYYNDSNIILVYKIPIVHSNTYDLFKLSLAPNHDNQILIPSYPFVAIHEKGLLYIEAECPKLQNWYLCEDALSHHHTDQSKCILDLIVHQQLHESCRFTSLILTTAAAEQLDDKHFIISFPNSTKVRLTCSQDQYRMLQGSYLTTIPKGCSLHTSTFTANNIYDRVKGKVLRILNIPDTNIRNSVHIMTIKLNSINLESLHSSNAEISLQEPVTLKPLEYDALYHTTIPVYSLIFGAALLIIIAVVVRRLKPKPAKTNEMVEGSNEIQLQDIAETEPKEIQRDPKNLSALFSTAVFK